MYGRGALSLECLSAQHMTARISRRGRLVICTENDQCHKMKGVQIRLRGAQRIVPNSTAKPPLQCSRMNQMRGSEEKPQADNCCVARRDF